MSLPTSKAQVDIASRNRVVRIGVESTFGTVAGSFEDAIFIDDALPNCTTQEIEVLDQSDYLFDDRPPVSGILSWDYARTFHVAPSSTQLDSAATYTEDFIGLIFKAAFRGQSVAAGSAVEASPSPTTTSFTVGTGHGTRFPRGQIVKVPINGVLETNQVIGQTGDALTFAWPFTAAPAAAASVINSDTYYLSQSGAQSLSIRDVHAVDTNYQWEMRGGRVSELTFKMDRESAFSADVKFDGGPWRGADAFSLPVTAATREVIQPLPMAKHQLWMTPTASPVASRPAASRYAVNAIDLKIMYGNQHIKEIGGDTEGLTGVAVGGDRAVVTLKLTCRTDRFLYRLREDRTPQLLCFDVHNGASGTSRRGVTIWIPSAMAINVPSLKDTEKMLNNEVTFRAQVNSLAASPSTDLARSPIYVARW